MKTIYERLKPEILASINADKQEYPYTTKALKEKLKKTTDVRSHLRGSEHIQILCNLPERIRS